MTAGRQDTMVSISRRGERVDAREEAPFAVFATVWADISAANVATRETGGRLLETQANRIVIYRSAATDTIQIGDRVQASTGPQRAWEVQAVNFDKPRAGLLELVCSTASVSGD